MEGELKSLIKVWLSVIASLCYCYFISSKIPKGKLRFLSLSPIFYLFTILPLSLSTVLPTGITAFFITWLTNFKLLLFSFDLGPLSSHPPKSLPLFIFIACFPIKIKQEKTYPSYQKPLNPKNPQNLSFDLQKNPKLHLNLPTKAFLFVLLVMGINEHKQNLHPKAVMGIYCCLLYLLVDTVMGLCNNLVQATIGGIELELPSDEPYCSTSLQDFWGRRWNLMVSNILRDTVYKPVRPVLVTLLGAQWASLLAVLLTFLVSGLMHELLFFYVTRVGPTWEVTLFFVLHGLCLVGELGVKKALAQKCQLHWAVSGPITVTSVVATADWLFFRPLVRNGSDEKAIKEFNVLVEYVKGKLKLV